MDIYPARELPIEGVDSSWLLSKIDTEHKKLVQKIDLVKVIKNSTAKVVVMLGAGDIGVEINQVTDHLLNSMHHEA